jgi:putative transposase
LWAEHRQVTTTATVSLYGNRYQVDPALAGHKVELVFDPFDLAQIQVRYAGRTMGAATPERLGRHVHPAARPDPVDPTAAPTPSGIDYLALVEARIAAQQRQRIAYATLPLPGPQPQPASDTQPTADPPATPTREP